MNASSDYTQVMKYYANNVGNAIPEKFSDSARPTGDISPDVFRLAEQSSMHALKLIPTFDSNWSVSK